MEEINQYIPWMIAIFSIGYLLIAFEHFIDINKAAIALIMGVVLWTLQFASHEFSSKADLNHLYEHLANASQVIFFLLAALIIVETINVHKGFRVITRYLMIDSKRGMLWIIGILTFFLSSVLDNLTTTIVMVSIIQKIVDDKKDRLLIGGGIVIAANAGGAWTPIGDVTTTMLWISERISTLKVMSELFIPSLVCLVVSIAILSRQLHGKLPQKKIHEQEFKMEPAGLMVLVLGLAVLVFVPVFKQLTGLPPFMGIILGLGILWVFTDLTHQSKQERVHLRVINILSKIEISGPLFFLGILLAVDALQASGLLTDLAIVINREISNIAIVATVIGLVSAVVDNIPLVAASIEMYTVSQYPIDSSFWQLIAYCAGTGGSILIIGSAAGVVFMAMEKVDFFAYLRKISVSALAGYFAGIIAYLLF